MSETGKMEYAPDYKSKKQLNRAIKLRPSGAYIEPEDLIKRRLARIDNAGRKAEIHTRFQSEVYNRFVKLQKQHEAAMNRAWLGALVTFTDDELRAIGDCLCPNDYALLKLAGRKLEMPPAVRRIIED